MQATSTWLDDAKKTSDYRNMADYSTVDPSKLNKEQKLAYLVATKWMEKDKDSQLLMHLQGNLNCASTKKLTNLKVTQYYLIYQGAGGTGKSVVCKTIAKHLIDKFPDEKHKFKILAPTGCAAYNVNGTTVHSGLQIPIKFSDDDPVHALSNDSLLRLQKDLEGVELIMIDEKSMVSTTKLYQIDQRLREARPEQADKPFGGISIILMVILILCNRK